MEEVQNLGDKNIWERESAKHNYTMLFFRIGKNWAQCNEIFGTEEVILKNYIMVGCVISSLKNCAKVSILRLKTVLLN